MRESFKAVHGFNNWGAYDLFNGLVTSGNILD
jgi:hypothetical protein